MMTLAETLFRIEELKQQLAVWNNVTNHLARFLDTETQEAPDGIRAPGCVSPGQRVRDKEVVPQNVIFDIIQGIEVEKISPLAEEISSLENLKVETKDDGQGQNSEQGQGSERPAAKAKPQNQKRVRVVAGQG